MGEKTCICQSLNENKFLGKKRTRGKTTLSIHFPTKGFSNMFFFGFCNKDLSREGHGQTKKLSSLMDKVDPSTR